MDKPKRDPKKELERRTRIMEFLAITLLLLITILLGSLFLRDAVPTVGAFFHQLIQSMTSEDKQAVVGIAVLTPWVLALCWYVSFNVQRIEELEQLIQSEASND